MHDISIAGLWLLAFGFWPLAFGLSIQKYINVSYQQHLIMHIEK